MGSIPRIGEMVRMRSDTARHEAFRAALVELFKAYPHHEVSHSPSLLRIDQLRRGRETMLHNVEDGGAEIYIYKTTRDTQKLVPE